MQCGESVQVVIQAVLLWRTLLRLLCLGVKYAAVGRPALLLTGPCHRNTAPSSRVCGNQATASLLRSIVCVLSCT